MKKIIVTAAILSFLIVTIKSNAEMKISPLGVTFPDNTTQTTSATGGSGRWSANGFNIYYNSGNVGIGTNNPSTKLTIQSTVYGDHVLNVGGTSNAKMLVRHIDGKDGESSDIGDLFLQYGMNHNTILNAESTGNVGIGTTNPNYKLDVDGDINTTGDIRKNGTAYNNPDYVFKKGYDLLPLGELKEFVGKNSHLPGMPSTQETKNNGVKLFEQNRLILEKLEEAYLYLIEMQDRIKKLENALTELKIMELQ